MKKHILSAIIGVIVLMLVQPAPAQENSLLHFMNTTPQAMRSNPANLPDSVSMYFGVPFLSNVNFGVSSPIAWSDIFTKRDDSLFVNPHLSNMLDENDRVFTDFNYDIFTYGQRFAQKHFLTVGLATKGYGSFSVPTDMIGLLIKGNSAFLNKPCEIDASLFGLAFGELALGYTNQIDKNWTVGGRVKLLIGLAGAQSDAIKMSLKTDKNTYDLLSTTDIRIKTASIGDAAIFDNIGVGFDAGVYYKTPIEGLEIGLSFIDWGSISWQGGLTNYEGSGNDKPVSFVGITDINAGGDMMEAFADTLKSQFDITDKPGTSFSTRLPGRILLSAAYNFSPADRLGFLFRTDALHNFDRTCVTLMYNRLVNDWFSVSAGNDIEFSQNFFNPTIAMNFKASTFQFYVAVDRLTAIYVRDMKGIGLQFGMAIVLY